MCDCWRSPAGRAGILWRGNGADFDCRALALSGLASAAYAGAVSTGKKTTSKAAVLERLVARLAELDAIDAAASGDAKPIELDQTAIGRLSRMDAMQVQAMAAASLRMRAVERTRIAAARKRLDADEYGLCVQCGESIAPARLETDPTLATCVTCASGGR